MSSGMEGLVKDFLSRKAFAVVGSFRSGSSVASRILEDLARRGHEVFPVNPRVSEVNGRVCYASVRDIPSGVDVIDIVTPPQVTEVILNDCLQKALEESGFNPAPRAGRS